MGFSYERIINDRNKFRKAATNHGDSFNRFDEPDLKYFKIFFYFINGNEEVVDIANSSGLLAPTWNIINIQENEYYRYNSAWSYLKNNGEDERAEMLKEFINLLSNISSESPWYFTEITGLDKALERNFPEAKFVQDERKSISIKCMEEPFDNRIGTMLDLYRAATFSWSTKREIVPANLRKFDMGIYIYSTPRSIFHHIKHDIIPDSEYDPIPDEYSYIDSITGYQTSYKYIELHNCEIDYNSPASAYGTLSNTEGNKLEHTINIFFDDCYEKRLNEFSAIQASDFIKLDIFGNDSFNLLESVDSVQQFELLKRASHFSFSPAARAINNMKEEITGTLKDVGSSIVKSIWLGNLYTGSLSNLAMKAEQAMDGNIMTTTRNSANIARDIKNEVNKNKHIDNLGNLYKADTIKNNI